MKTTLAKKNKGGRPTKLVPDTITKLESIFKIGGTIEEACSYAGIAPKTYHAWVKEDNGFVTKMTAAQHYADVAAKNVVVQAITKDKDLNTAKWWLEKRQFQPHNMTQINVEVKPLLGGISNVNNDSDEKDIETTQED